MDNNSLAHTKWECKYHIGLCQVIVGTLFDLSFPVILVGFLSLFQI